MKNAWRKSRTAWLPVLVTALTLGACSSNEIENNDTPKNNNGVPLVAQTGQASALFFGNTNYKKLGSITNARVFNPNSPGDILVSSDDIMAMATGRPQPATTLVGYNPADHSYTDLYVDSLYYVKGGNPKRVDMLLGHDMATHTDVVPEEKAHSKATGLINPAYAEVNYLGTKRFLIATDAKGQQVIVCPTADGTEIAVPFANKKFITLSYSTYGEMPSAAVVYDSQTFKFQKMVPPSEGCAVCNEPGTELSYTDYAGGPTKPSGRYTFLGDIGGTVQSAVIIDGALYILDKAALTLAEQPLTPQNTTVTPENLLGASGKGAIKFSGDSAFFIYKDDDGVANLYRVNVVTGALTQLTSDHGDAEATPKKIHSVTDEWVIYGTDGLMLAAKKTDSQASPRLLVENTKTSGIRYPFNFGIGGHYLYVTYKLDPTTAMTTYQACVFDAGGVSSCRENSFWAAVSAKRQGKLNFTSDYPYTPYAYVRVDDTDNFGGGMLKAIDPAKPLDDGFSMGKIEKYNFNTFLHASHYLKTTIDTEGSIVIYGKRDEDFVGDAFLINLLKPDSVVNLSQESAPAVADLTGGDLHCHGRSCATCHNFAGGKIYGDKEGKVETVGYTVKFEFENGSNTLALPAKGKGENFRLMYESFAGNFTPVIVRTTDGSEIKRAQKFGHFGLLNSNCNYCHAKGDLRNGAPAVISIAP